MWTPAGWVRAEVRAAAPGSTPRRRPQAQRRQGRARKAFELAPAGGERLWAAAWTFPLSFPLSWDNCQWDDLRRRRTARGGFLPGRLPVLEIEAPGQTLDFHDARAAVKDAKQSPAAPGPRRVTLVYSGRKR